MTLEYSSATALVTGGGSGIGLALAARLMQAGAKVIVCGRRTATLREAHQRHPGLEIRTCDLARESERIALAAWAAAEHPGLNLLVNNAGIQRHVKVGQAEDWGRTQEEIAINLEAPIHLASLFLPQLRGQQYSAIVNVTSGLAFVPLARVPIYSATKAALHSFTLSLRHQLAGTPVAVIEILPPAVDTDLGGPGLHTFGVPLDEFADAVMPRLLRGELEIAYGFAEQASHASRGDLDETFKRMNARA